MCNFRNMETTQVSGFESKPIQERRSLSARDVFSALDAGIEVAENVLARWAKELFSVAFAQRPRMLPLTECDIESVRFVAATSALIPISLNDAGKDEALQSMLDEIIRALRSDQGRLVQIDPLQIRIIKQASGSYIFSLKQHHYYE